MGLISKIKNWFAGRRNYDAGMPGRNNSRYNPVNQSGEFTDLFFRDRVRARARDLERNSDIMQALLWARRRNVIGKGFTLQAKTPRDGLNDQLEQEWVRWTRAHNCDVTGTQSLNDILRMCVTRKQVDGGVLLAKTYTRHGSLPFKLQIIEVDELDGSVAQGHYKKSTVIGGVEIDDNRRVLGYWVRQYQFDGKTPTDSVFLPAKNVLFYFSKARPSQVREMSDMAPLITGIQHTNEFIHPFNIKQRVEACLSVLLEKGAATGPAYGRMGAVKPDPYNYDDMRLEPGMVRTVPNGTKATVINPTGQGADANSVVKLNLRKISAGGGMSYEAVYRDLSESNYSSARQSLIEDEFAFAEEEERVLAILDEIYETFVVSAVMCGAVEIPDFWDNKAKYFRHVWIKQPKPWIDPQKEANANKIALEAGIKTHAQVWAENGWDAKDMIDALAEECEYAEKQGIKLGGELYVGNEPGPEPEVNAEAASGDNTGAADAESGQNGAEDSKKGGKQQ